MRSKHHLLLPVLVGLLVMTGCSTDREPWEFYAPSDIETLVVDAVLIVDRPFPGITLSRTTTPDRLYSPAADAESDAVVGIWVEPSGPFVRYQETSLAGYYVQVSHFDVIVEPNKTYELRVFTTRDEFVTARTKTPERFGATEWVLLNDEGTVVRQTLRRFEELGDNVYAAPENQLTYTDGLLEVRFDRIGVLGYHVGVFSLDLDSDYVIDPAFFEDEDFEDLERNISSPAFEALEGTIRLPWFAIFFQERYKIKVYAVDQNWYELILTLPEFSSGFGGEIGDNFERPHFNVNGGIGLFGSASVDSIGFYMHPRP